MRKKALLLVLLVGAIATYFLFRSPPAGPGPDRGAATAAAGPTVRPPRAKPLVGPDGEPKGPSFSEQTPGKEIFTAAWGSGPGNLGRDRPEEGNPIGPMSLGVDAKGRVHVLDGVNGRIVRRGADGKPDGSIKVDYLEPQDIAVGEDGTTAVLDRFTEKSVAVYDDSGVLRGELPLEGEGISDVGEVTGVFVDGTDVYAEREHGQLVRIGDTSGQVADPQTEVAGRPTRDGLSWINAGITDAPAGRVYVTAIDRPTNQHRFTRELKLRVLVRSIVLLDSDKTGTIYFAAEVEPEGTPPVIVLSCLEPLKGIPVGGAILPVNTLPEETFRDFTVLDEGGVIHALRTEQGVTYTRYDCE